MGYPDGVGAIDLMIGFPFKDKKATYEYLRAGRPIVALTDPIGDTAEVVRAAGIDAVARLDSVDDTVALLRRLIPAIRAGTAPLPNADYVASASRRGRSRELAALLEAAVLRR